MRIHPKAAGMQLRSSVLLIAIVGNLFFSAFFVLSTGVHVIKTGNNGRQTVKTEKEAVKEQKVVTLAQIN